MEGKIKYHIQNTSTLLNVYINLYYYTQLMLFFIFLKSIFP